MRDDQRPSATGRVTKLGKRAPASTARRAVRDHIRAWWDDVLIGRSGTNHPKYGPAIRAHTDGDTLIIAGTVPSLGDRRQVADEAESLRGRGIKRVRNQLRVVRQEVEAPGVYVQTLLSTFATAAQAAYAKGFFEGTAQFTPVLIRMMTPDRKGPAVAALRAILPPDYWPDGERALRAGQALLIVTVDETDAFRARELLEEESRSLRTLALPPVPARADDLADRALEHPAEAAAGATRSPDAPPRASVRKHEP
jgi:hypothetical protein